MDKINTQITVCHSLLLLFLVVSGCCDSQPLQNVIEIGSDLEAQFNTTIIPIPLINLPTVTYPNVLTSDTNYLTQLVTTMKTTDAKVIVKNLTNDEKYLIDEIIAESKLSRVQLKPDEQNQVIQQNGQRNSHHNYRADGHKHYHQLNDGIYYQPITNNQKLSSSESAIKAQQKTGHETKEEHNHIDEESGEKDTNEHDEKYHSDIYQTDKQNSYGGGFKSGNKNQKQRVEKGYFREFHKDEYKKLDNFFSNSHMGGEYKKFGTVKQNDNNKGNSKNAVYSKYNQKKIKGFKKSLGKSSVSS